MENENIKEQLEQRISELEATAKQHMANFNFTNGALAEAKMILDLYLNKNKEMQKE